MKNFLILIMLFGFNLFADNEGLNPRYYQEEKITSFISDVIIREDGVIEVTENIKVYADGTNIKRGIFRDFPLNYKDNLNNNIKVKFNLISVMKDGFDEKCRIDKKKNFLRIYIGDEDVYLNQGFYTYRIKYETNRQMGFYKDHDELYWNVNGNYWSFPVKTIECNVYLPLEAFKRKIMLDGFTGYLGYTGKEYTAVIDSVKGCISFKGSRRFESNEGMTVLVGIAKNIIAEPTTKERIKYFLNDNRDILFAFSGMLLLFVFFYFSWLKVGKDPEKSTIIPLYQPSDGLSPAEMRYIMRMGYDTKTTTSAILDIAVKGKLIIEEKEGKYILKKSEHTSMKMLSEDEESVYLKLFGLVSEMVLSNSNYEIMSGAIKNHASVLKKKFNDKYFFNNTKYFTAGLIMTLIIVIVTFFISDKMNPVALFMYVWLSIWSVGVAALIGVSAVLWREAIRSKKQMGGALFMSLFSIPFIAGEVVGIAMLFANSSILINIAFFIMIIFDILFYKWLKAPSYEGRAVMDRIEGFKMYLSVSEKDQIADSYKRLNNSKEYEKYLPYAVALDVEDAWTNAFDSALKYSGKSSSEYKPLWFMGSYAGIQTFSSTFHSSFNTAVSAASISPKRSSSSGFSGGSSGGGGGGGGGGGW